MARTCWHYVLITTAESRSISRIPVATGACPHCQNHENSQWIENQLNKRLPAIILPGHLYPPRTAQGSCLEESDNNLFPVVCLCPGCPEDCPKQWVVDCVLPKGFRRARCYGFLHPCSKKLIRFLQMVLLVNPFSMFAGKLRKRASIICPVCGATMEIILTRISKPPTRQRSPASLLPDQAAIPQKRCFLYNIRAYPTNGSDCGSLRSHNPTLFVRAGTAKVAGEYQ